MKNFSKDIVELLNEAWSYQYKEIGEKEEVNKENKPYLFFSNFQFVIIIVCILLIIIKTDGFGNEFSGYIISSLSLFVGLFFTFIIVLYDKFKSIDFSKHKKDINLKLYHEGVRMKNFFKKITILTLYAILLSLICIVLLCASLLFPDLSNNLSYKRLTFDKFLYIENLILIFKTFYRLITYYFILDFLLITVYIISAFYDFLIGEYDRVKLR